MAAKRPRIKTSHGTTDRASKPGARPKPQPPTSRPVPTTGLRAPTTERRPTTRKARESDPSESTASPGARELATLIAIAGLDKKAMGLEILDVAGKVDYADFLVLMTGRSDRHVVSLAQGIEHYLREKKSKRPVAVEGMTTGKWVLMDYGDVVVHVFQDDVRTLYDLEGLWLDAHRLPVPSGVEE